MLRTKNLAALIMSGALRRSEDRSANPEFHGGAGEALPLDDDPRSGAEEQEQEVFSLQETAPIVRFSAASASDEAHPPAPPRKRNARQPIERRLAQIEARRQTLKARLGKLQRTRHTRRSFLLGSLILHGLEHNDPIWLRDWLKAELPLFLTREADRELFADLL